MKTDLYLLIHKAQRCRLFALANEIGRCDFADAAAAATVAAGVRDLLDRLEDHAHTEETYIHPLFRQLGWDLGAFDESHRRLDGRMRHLQGLLRDQRWNELYPAFCAFTAEYLVHTADEERAQAEVLWTRCTDEALADTLRRFKAERPAQRAATDLEFMLPALSVPEIAELYRAMRANAPAAIYAQACERGARALGTLRWEQALQRIG
jgi:hypothetical protein